MKRIVWKQVWLVGCTAAMLAGVSGIAADGAAGERPARRPWPPPETLTGGVSGADASKPDRPRLDLHLTAEQRAKMQAANQELREQMRQLRAETGLTSEQRREKARQLHEKHARKVKEILTPEQFEKWKQMRQPRGRGAVARGQANPAGDQPGHQSPQRPVGR